MRCANTLHVDILLQAHSTTLNARVKGTEWASDKKFGSDIGKLGLFTGWILWFLEINNAIKCCLK